MTRFRLKAKNFIHKPDGKLHYNRELFSSIAGEYSRMSGVLSFGRDRPWKQRLIQRLPPLESPRCLDLASGNGDLAEYILARYHNAKVTALDLTVAMIELARRRFADDERIDFVVGDMTVTGLPSESFDLITVGYGLRNAPSLDLALAEIARLLRPGGIVAALDFSRWNRASQVEVSLLRFWCGLWGLIRSGNADTYGYIADSLAQYPTRRELHRIFGEHRLEIVEAKTHFLGVIETCIAVKGI